MVSWFRSLFGWQRVVVIGFALVLVVHLTAIMHRRGHQTGDFDVVRDFGRGFLERLPLCGGGCFNYMPIAAMYFSPLAMASAPIAFLGRYLVALLCLALTLKWLMELLPANLSSQKRFGIVALTLLFTLKYIVRDLDDGGPHLILVGMLVAGMSFVRRGKELAGGVCFALAIVLKMTPGLLLPYLAWKRRWRLLTVTVLATAILIVSPALWLGPSLWWNCQKQWNDVAFCVFSGKEHDGLNENDLRVQNQSLKMAVMHSLVVYPEGHSLHRASEILSLFDWPLQQARLAANLLLVCLLGFFWRQTRQPGLGTGAESMPLELSGLFLLMVLLSPVTWVQHLVFALPAVFFILADPQRKPMPVRIALGMYLILALVLNREILGKEKYLFLLACHIHTAAMLILLGLVLWLRARPGIVAISDTEPRALSRAA
jgi:alpha-1,2-mannosyltransferase